jgi:hypothetical protein
MVETLITRASSDARRDESSGEHELASPAAADDRTGAEARTAGRSVRRGPMIRAAMLNTLRVAVS